MRDASDDVRFLRLAIQKAREGYQTPGAAQVGAVLVKDGMVDESGFNEGDMRHDPTAHAEMVVIRRLCSKLKATTLEGYTIYCTLQPCGMCSMACLWAGISRVVYGAGRDDVNSVYFESRHFDTADFIRQAFRDDMEIEGGVLSEECSSLYMKKEEPAPPDPAHKQTKQAT